MNAKRMVLALVCAVGCMPVYSYSMDAAKNVLGGAVVIGGIAGLVYYADLADKKEYERLQNKRKIAQDNGRKALQPVMQAVCDKANQGKLTPDDFKNLLDGYTEYQNSDRYYRDYHLKKIQQQPTQAKL